MGKKIKKTRARSKIAKEKQIHLIIEAGKNLFLKYGSEGMSMRKLAKKLNMGSGSASSLYTYFESKRELWFAIMKYEFKIFEGEMERIFQNHKGTYKEVLLKIAHFYFEYALADPDRYTMMFQIKAPPSDNIGPIEREYESRSIFYLKSIISNAIEAGEIRELDDGKLSYFLWGLLHGPITVIQTELFGNSELLPKIGSKKEYFIFLENYIKKIIELL